MLDIWNIYFYTWYVYDFKNNSCIYIPWLLTFLQFRYSQSCSCYENVIIYSLGFDRDKWQCHALEPVDCCTCVTCTWPVSWAQGKVNSKTVAWKKQGYVLNWPFDWAIMRQIVIMWYKPCTVEEKQHCSTWIAK